MFGFSLGLWAKVVAGAVVLALLAGAYGYVANLRATIADQRTMINQVTAERDQEKRTAEKNAAAVAELARRHAAEVEARKRWQATAEAERRRTATRVKELQRAPTANDPLPPAYRPFLRLQ